MAASGRYARGSVVSALIMINLSSHTVATEAVKKLLDQSITQVTEIRRLGRGQSIGSRAINSTRPRLKFRRLPPRINRSMQLNISNHGSDFVRLYEPFER